jgi:twitching motility protein PilT
LNCTAPVRTLIRENNLVQIRAFIQMGSQKGIRSMNQSLIELFQKGIISSEEAESQSNDKEEFRRLIQNFPET